MNGLREARPDNPHLAYALGRVEMDSGTTVRAVELLTSAAAGFSRRGDALGEAYSRLNLGTCLSLQGDLDAVDAQLDEAERAAATAADPDLLAQVRIARARFLRSSGGDLARALRILRQLEDQLHENASYSVQNSLLRQLVRVLTELGRDEEALRVLERRVLLTRQANRPFDEANARVNLAVTFTNMPPRKGSREMAILLTEAALDSAQRSGRVSSEMKARELLGKLLPDADSRMHLERCALEAERRQRPRQLCACLFALAGSLAAERPAEARATLDRALKLAASSDHPWTVAYGWGERFRVRWATSTREEAIADSLAVLDLIENLRRLQDAESGRAGLFSGWAEVYYALVGRLLEVDGGPSRDDLGTAFDVAERLRARVLLDGLRAADATPRSAAGDAARVGVLREIVDVQRVLQDPELPAERRVALLTELDRLELALEDAGRSGDEHDRGGDPSSAEPSDVAGRDNDRIAAEARARDIEIKVDDDAFATLDEVESSLAPDQALLSFLLAPDEDVFGKPAGGSWLFASTAGGTRVYRMPDRLDLEPKVAIVLGLVEGGDEGDLAAASAHLWEALLAEAVTELPAGVAELILVPDGALHLLPFALLRPHPQLDPLAARFRLSSVPSATLWRRWRQRPPAAAAPALALADPAFLGDAGGAGTALNRDGGHDGRHDAAEGVAATVEDAPSDRAWALDRGRRLGRLPWARREGRTILRRLGGAPHRLLVDAEATEAAVKSAPLAAYGTLHFAAHALLDERRPERSAILLAAGDPGEDGLLQPREIATLGLDDKLVVLSACRGAAGQLLLGEGVQSLSRAFFRAGARTVVASHWPLRDDHAAAFFDPFYRSLARGASVAQAVADARAERRRAGDPAAAWAAVVVLGDGGLVPWPGGIAPPWWRRPAILATAALFLASILGWAIVRRTRRRRAAPGPSGDG